MRGGVNKRRTLEKSDLYRIAYQHFEEYEKVYPERYEKKYVARRQWAFTIPKALRKLFYKDRLLLAELARCAAAAILELYKAIFLDYPKKN